MRGSRNCAAHCCQLCAVGVDAEHRSIMSEEQMQDSTAARRAPTVSSGNQVRAARPHAWGALTKLQSAAQCLVAVARKAVHFEITLHTMHSAAAPIYCRGLPTRRAITRLLHCFTDGTHCCAYHIRLGSIACTLQIAFYRHCQPGQAQTHHPRSPTSG
jgi:hypothetical protein